MDPEVEKLLIELAEIMQRVLASGMADFTKEKRQEVAEVIAAGHAFLAIHVVLSPPASDVVGGLQCDLVSEHASLAQLLFRLRRPDDPGAGGSQWVN